MRSAYQPGIKMLKVIVFFMCCSTLLTACTPKHLTIDEYNEYKAAATKADYGTYPSNYEKIAKDYLNKYLKDPESARIECISKPYKSYVEPDIESPTFISGYVFSVNVNSKNSYGGYTGITTILIRIKNGVVLSAFDTGKRSDCHPNSWLPYLIF